MGVFFGTTEITGMHFGEQEITEIFFGNTEIFSVWAEYDGTLPAQYSANGDNLADYRIYGSAGGVGDRTENLCTQLIAGTYETTGYETTYAHMACTTHPILFDEGKITISVSQGSIYIKKIENGVSVQTIVAAAVPPATTTIPSPGTYVIQINTAITDQALKEINDTIVAVKGSTAPTSYIPYGYEVDMSVSDGTTSTTTPIYIGSSPLGEDEYVDYREGKIYRMSGGVLTPTDPPVPLPALPTVDGTNIVDYAGQSAAVPSRFVVKYRKEGI